MKRVIFAASLLLAVWAAFGYAAEKTDSIFPAVHPGMKQEEVKALYPNMTVAKGSPKGAAGFTIRDNGAASSIRLLFVEDKLAMLTYQIKEKKLSEVVETAKKAYGNPVAGDGTESFEFTSGGFTLMITGDEDDGTGKVTFVDPEAMKKISR